MMPANCRNCCMPPAVLFANCCAMPSTHRGVAAYWLLALATLCTPMSPFHIGCIPLHTIAGYHPAGTCSTPMPQIRTPLHRWLALPVRDCPSAGCHPEGAEDARDSARHQRQAAADAGRASAGVTGGGRRREQCRGGCRAVRAPLEPTRAGDGENLVVG